MAIITRYFSTASAGAADGTSWANRGVLFSGGAWSTVISGFNFGGSDSLLCLIGPGTYTISLAYDDTIFSLAPPDKSNPCILHGCDSSGTQLSPPDQSWMASEAPWSDASLPEITTTTDIYTINQASTILRMLKLTASGRNSYVVSAERLSWCHVINSTAHTSAAAALGQAEGCVLKCTGTSYSRILGIVNGYVHNCKVIGVTGSSGNRNGIEYTGTTAPAVIDECCVTGNGGNGIAYLGSNTSARYAVTRSVVAGNGGTGILAASTASQTQVHAVADCMITGNGAYGVNGQSGARILLDHNRLRDNTSGNTNGLGNYPATFDNYTTDSDDATEYVDTSSNDYRIKAAATIWGMGFGVSEQPRTAASAQVRRWRYGR